MIEFDLGFVQMLRDEVGDDQLDLVWRDDMMRIRATEDDARQPWWTPGDRGCWVVTKMIRQCVPMVLDDGAVVICSQEVPWCVFVLNGNHGLPMTPGRWVIDAMVAADTMRHGKARTQEMDEWREGKVKEEQRMRNEIAKDRAQDTMMYELMKLKAEELGLATPDKGEMIAMERDAVMSAQRLAEQDLRARKHARLR